MFIAFDKVQNIKWKFYIWILILSVLKYQKLYLHVLRMVFSIMRFYKVECGSSHLIPPLQRSENKWKQRDF
jgi:hypothetical protein